jgi:hypothetical protein
MSLVLLILACAATEPELPGAPGAQWSPEAITAGHRAATPRPMSARELLAQVDAHDPQIFDGGPPRPALDVGRWRAPFVGHAQARHAAEVMLFLRAELGEHPGLPSEAELREAALESTDGWPPEGAEISRLRAAYGEKGWRWPLR